MTQPEPIPTYSLLEKHEPEVKYIIPNPYEDNEHVFVELASFELEDDNYEEKGIQLLLEYKGKTRKHEQPDSIKEMVSSNFNILSRGFQQYKQTFRFQGHSPSEIRELAKDIAYQTFVNWYILNNHTNWEPFTIKDETSIEKREQRNPIEYLNDSGLVKLKDDREIMTPYTREDIELYHIDEYNSPVMKMEEELRKKIKEFESKYPNYMIDEALSNISVNLPKPTKTTEKKQKEELESFLLNIDGIGRNRMYAIINEFNSIEELQDDIYKGGDTIKNISKLTENVVENIKEAVYNI